MINNTQCQICGKQAIGMQIFGCCPSIVCETHADKFLLTLAPGEKKGYEACYFWRYKIPEE